MIPPIAVATSVYSKLVSPSSPKLSSPLSSNRKSLAVFCSSYAQSSLSAFTTPEVLVSTNASVDTVAAREASQSHVRAGTDMVVSPKASPTLATGNTSQSARNRRYTAQEKNPTNADILSKSSHTSLNLPDAAILAKIGVRLSYMTELEAPLLALARSTTISRDSRDSFVPSKEDVKSSLNSLTVRDEKLPMRNINVEKLPMKAFSSEKLPMKTLSSEKLPMKTSSPEFIGFKAGELESIKELTLSTKEPDMNIAKTLMAELLAVKEKADATINFILAQRVTNHHPSNASPPINYTLPIQNSNFRSSSLSRDPEQPAYPKIRHRSKSWPYFIIVTSLQDFLDRLGTVSEKILHSTPEKLCNITYALSLMDSLYDLMYEQRQMIVSSVYIVDWVTNLIFILSPILRVVQAIEAHNGKEKEIRKKDGELSNTYDESDFIERESTNSRGESDEAIKEKKPRKSHWWLPRLHPLESRDPRGPPVEQIRSVYFFLSRGAGYLDLLN